MGALWEWFEFEARFKIWLTGNHYPQVDDSSHSFWRRVHLVPFSERIEVPDPEVLSLLAAERSGILNWLIRGTRMYLDEGLSPTEQMSMELAEYRQESDSLAEFIAECCETDTDFEVSATELWNGYRRFARVERLNRIRRREFKSSLEDLGFTQLPRRSCGLFYSGLRLRETGFEPPRSTSPEDLMDSAGSS